MNKVENKMYPRQRAELQASVAMAARILPTYWPLETFIAVNPLHGLENLPFKAAVAKAGKLFGARGTLSEPAFRAAYKKQRVTDIDLQNTLQRWDRELVQTPFLGENGEQLLAQQLFLCDLIHGIPAPTPHRSVYTYAERFTPALANQINGELEKWCGAFFDTTQARWQMPGREHGFYRAWRELAGRDFFLRQKVREYIQHVSQSPEDAICEALELLCIPASHVRSYLEAHLTALPGWAAHIHWHAERGGDFRLVEYLAVRLSYEVAFLGADGMLPSSQYWENITSEVQTEPLPNPHDRAIEVAKIMLKRESSTDELTKIVDLLTRLPVADRVFLWLDAYEAHYRDQLLEELTQKASAQVEVSKRPVAQLVCCIDARSEGLRRHFEALGDYETFGFAGFFAVAIQFQNLAGGEPDNLCPVLVQPKNQVHEQPLSGEEWRAQRQIAGQHTLAAWDDSFHVAKNDAVAPFALAEITGWFAGPLAAVKTLFAKRYVDTRAQVQKKTAPAAPTTLNIETAFSLQERVLFAEVALKMFGLTKNFAQLVVLCGHGSSSENNPYESALACGACGGKSGGPNARTAVAILNDESVQEQLIAKGIVIPKDTWFVAAEHDTTVDTVKLLDIHCVPQQFHEQLDDLNGKLAITCENLILERSGDLPGSPNAKKIDKHIRHVRGRGSDWAQVFPEWGLAGNAAFLVGPRSISGQVNLKRRVFLHSYDASVDPDGVALETILTAPLIVAQWINCQYYFSTVDPAVFGAGTKTIHNVTGGRGVLAGHGGDLQLGLPWQSLADGQRLVHEPMRLLAIVQAPIEQIDKVIDRNSILQDLFGNSWLALAARKSPQEQWLRKTQRSWEPWKTQEKG